MRYILSPRLMLPMMIFFGVLIMGMRISDIWQAAESGRIFAPSAMAQSQSESASDAAKPDVAPADAPKADAASAAAPAAAAAPGDAGVPTLPSLAGPPPDDTERSPAELEVLRQLSDRRQQLEKRSRDLDTREALIKVTEQRVDQKIKEMEALRQQLQTMVNQIGEAQAAQTENLVKIYETMKPEEAARIFETLDMPVLLNVIQRMKPKSTAPIMAKMAPEKAKDVTDALTHQDQLPKIK